MKKILFLIHNLGPCGAERVLVNLVNHMDSSRFDITVMSIFDVGVSRQFLAPHIHYRYCFRRMFRGNSHLMKLFSPRQLHRLLIRDRYDIEVAFLEGPCSRIIAGCQDRSTQLFSWIHITQPTAQVVASSFRSVEEAVTCYNSFHRINCVSRSVLESFTGSIPVRVPIGVVYNTNDVSRIRQLRKEPVEGMDFPEDLLTIVGVGRLAKQKGFDRLIRAVAKLRQDKLRVRLIILGEGSEESRLRSLIRSKHLEDSVFLLGYQVNPYKYMVQCDLFACASYAEGFSTAASEALILGVPVCTVEVAGMKEMLGENNEYGVVVPNDEAALYQGIKELVSDRKLLGHYREMARKRGEAFSTEESVRRVEGLFLEDD